VLKFGKYVKNRSVVVEVLCKIQIFLVKFFNLFLSFQL